MEKQLIPQLRFSEFNKKWSKEIITNISDKITDGTHDTPKPIKKGIPFLTAIHIKDGKIDFDNCYYLSKEEHNKIYKRCNPEYGDLLMVNIGAGTATSAMVNVDYEFSLKNVALIKPKRNIIEPSFFAQVQRRNSNRLRHEISSGGAQPFLSLKAIGKLKLNIPELPEQQKIASFLTDVDDKITKITKKKELLERFKKGIMQKIFNQELRFKDDNGNAFPNWNVKKLGDITTINMGQSPESSTYNGNGVGYYLIQGNADISNRKTTPRNWTSNPTKLCDIGDLILTVRAPVGAIAKSNHQACIGRGVCSIRNIAISNIEFIYQFLLDYEKRWARLEQGSTFTAVSGKDIKSIEIKLPSIEEQTKIANFLSDIDLNIEAINTKIEKSKTFKKGLLQKMFV
jgi:type I restriction enzyme S subunit